MNEPISEELWNAIDLPHRYPPRDPEYARGSEPVPTGFLKDFYTTAYRRIRAQSDDVIIVFHDGFRIREWDGFFTGPDFERIVLDTHLYLMEYTFRTGDESLDGYLGHIRNEFGPTVREMSRQLPLIVDEWCLDPMSSVAVALTGEERLKFYRSLADAQLAAWDGAAGWFFWNYKLLVEGSDRDGCVTWALAFSPALRGMAAVRVQDGQGGQPGQDLVLADVQVLRWPGLSGGAGVGVTAPVGRLAVGPGRFQPSPAGPAGQQPGQQVPPRRRARRAARRAGFLGGDVIGLANDRRVGRAAEITHPAGRFHRCTWRWPSPVLAGSTRSRSVRCRFHTCRPV